MKFKDMTRDQLDAYRDRMIANRAGLQLQLYGLESLPKNLQTDALTGQKQFLRNVVGWINGELGRLEQHYASVSTSAKTRTQDATRNANGRRTKRSRQVC